MPAQSTERDLVPFQLETVRKHAFQVSRATVHIVDTITSGTMKVMVMGLRRTEAAAMSELQVKRQRIAAAEMNVQRLTRQARL